MNGDILVVLEYRQGTIQPIGLELLGFAGKLALQARCKVLGVVIGWNTQAAKAQLEGYALHSVLLCETPDRYFRADVYAGLLCGCIEQLCPSVVLVGGTDQGRALAPRAAVYFRTGLTADCTELSIREDGLLEQVRPAFGGNVMASILTPKARPQFATVRPGVMAAAKRDSQAHIVFLPGPVVPGSPIRVLDAHPLERTQDITTAKTLVVAGKGVCKQEDMSMLRRLAKALGGELACSRGVVERGWLPGEQQIGLSGHTVAPNLLVACGVSGSVQFMAGMRRAGTIVALNTDPEAPIFSIAHHPLLADIYEVIPQALELLYKN